MSDLMRNPLLLVMLAIFGSGLGGRLTSPDMSVIVQQNQQILERVTRIEAAMTEHDRRIIRLEERKP